MRRLAAVLGLLISLLAPIAAHAQTAPACQFVLGFQTLHDLDSTDTGDCIDNQAFAGNGDAQQHTGKGLMAWRKADNWTAFTNGYTTWINGPSGLANRLNTTRFSWEADYAIYTLIGTKVDPATIPVGACMQGTVYVDPAMCHQATPPLLAPSAAPTAAPRPTASPSPAANTWPSVEEWYYLVNGMGPYYRWLVAPGAPAGAWYCSPLRCVRQGPSTGSCTQPGPNCMIVVR